MKSKSILSILSVVLVITSLLVVLQVATPVPVFAPPPPTLWVAAPPTVTVTPPGTSCTAPGYNTISAAVAAAVAGDTINVCTGTYTEQVTVPISLTLTGVPYPHHSSPAPIIQAPGTMTADSFGLLNIVEITGAITVTFQGFTVTGPYTGINSGIFVSAGATANILQNTIEHIHDAPAITGDQNGQGILVGHDPTYESNTANTVGTATISHNTIFDYQKGGIVVDNTGSTATITQNTVTGVGPTTVIEQNGIVILVGAVATVSFNTVTGNECNIASPTCGPDILANSQSCGILVGFGSGAEATVTDNTVSGNDIGIELYEAASATTIRGNTVTGNRYAGMELSDGTYTASFNTVRGPGNVGIAAVAYYVNTSVTLSSNTISHVAVASIGAYASPGYTATVLSS